MNKSMRRRVYVSGTFEERKDEGRGSQDRIGSDLIDSQPVQIVEDFWSMYCLGSKRLNRGTLCESVTVKNRELRATDARAFIKIRRQVLLKENNRLARIMAELHARQESHSLSPSFGSTGSHPGNDEHPQKYCVNSPIVSRRVATRRVATRHLVLLRVPSRPSCRDAIRLCTRIFMPLYSIIK